MTLKNTGISGADRYQIIRESPEYPRRGTVTHYVGLKACEDELKSPERDAVRDELSAWENRGVREGIWSAVYELVRGFRSEPSSSGIKADTKIAGGRIFLTIDGDDNTFFPKRSAGFPHELGTIYSSGINGDLTHAQVEQVFHVLDAGDPPPTTKEW